MNINKKISESINSGVNIIIARFLAAVFGVVLVVAVLTYTGVFLTTPAQINMLLIAALPGALYGALVIFRKNIRDDSRTKYVLCFLMCVQALAVALAGYSYAGTMILLAPILLAALYPKSLVSDIVSVSMVLCGLILPPLALAAGLWDGEYYEFLYTLAYGRPMETSILSDAMLTRQEQIISAIRFCSSQNVLIVGGYALIGRLIYRRTNKSFESQKDVLRLSETDELTGLFNRNCFERRLNETVACHSGSMTCFYFDVNGLHEMNNLKGHKAGDEMLRFVGRKIQEVFGEDNTFRVGGDEYVAFSLTLEPESLADVKDNLEKAFTSAGYHVAAGYAQSTSAADINELVQLAEKEMYQEKNRYYCEQGSERQTMRAPVREAQ